MKMLLLGAEGQVGSELQRSLAPLGELKACNRKNVDLENLDDLRTVIRNDKPDIIINAAAYTAVDKAESEPDKANCINAEAVGLIANETKRLKACLVHYSTDYIFDGTKSGTYTESDIPKPLSVYGKTKLSGEENIRASGCQHLIFRTSWIHGRQGSNFIKTILNHAKTKNNLKIISDQFGAPTSAALIADITAQCLHQLTSEKDFSGQMSGTYHLSATGVTNWYEYAQFVITAAQKNGLMLSATPKKVRPVTTADNSQQAVRPANSQLDCQKLISVFKVHLPPWQQDVKTLVSELVNQDIS